MQQVTCRGPPAPGGLLKGCCEQLAQDPLNLPHPHPAWSSHSGPVTTLSTGRLHSAGLDFSWTCSPEKILALSLADSSTRRGLSKASVFSAVPWRKDLLARIFLMIKRKWMRSPSFRAWHTASAQQSSLLCPLNLLVPLTLPDCQLTPFPRTSRCWVSNYVSFHQDPFFQPNNRVNSLSQRWLII